MHSQALHGTYLHLRRIGTYGRPALVRRIRDRNRLWELDFASLASNKSTSPGRICLSKNLYHVYNLKKRAPLDTSGSVERNGATVFRTLIAGACSSNLGELANVFASLPLVTALFARYLWRLGAL